MGLYRRDKIYWFSITFQGRRVQESLKTNNRKLAEKLYAKVMTDMIEGRYFTNSLAKTIMFQEMTSKYLVEHAHSRDPISIKALSRFFNEKTLFEMTTRTIAEYKRQRLEMVKPATVYQELALLRRMFNVAMNEWEWVKDNPVSRLSFSVGNKNARYRWLTVEEEQRLIDCAANPQWLRTLLVVALQTGMRRGEILDLKWQDVDFARRTIMIVKSKNGERRTIPMSNFVQEVLRKVKIRDISGKVFPIAVRSLRAAYDKALSKAGIEDFTFHDLRHTFATRLVQNGVDLYKVKELLGHKTLAMTARYAHHYPESLRASIETLNICYNSATIGIKNELTKVV